MSLTGNLEDLPLLDILQIVSFSKKTGYLSIRTGAGEGAIVFRDGFVTSSFTWDTAPLDSRARTLSPEQRARMLRHRIEVALQQLIRLVDDEEEVRRILADHFTSGGYQVVEAEDPEAAVKKAGRLGKAGIPFLVVSDLGMPTSGGSSFQGGFEVVKRLGKMNLHPPVLMMTE